MQTYGVHFYTRGCAYAGGLLSFNDYDGEMRCWNGQEKFGRFSGDAIYLSNSNISVCVFQELNIVCINIAISK